MKDKKVSVREGIRLPLGFRAAGVAAGIKAGDARDLALIVSDGPAAAAGVFTSNQVKAAPVRLDQEHLRRRSAQAIVVNSGNANACTGPRGFVDAMRMAFATGDALAIPPRQVLVCSTGVIGKPMPMPAVEAGIRIAATRLSRNGGTDAAEAIMTTDTAPKRVHARITVNGRPVTVTAMAKGAGMIHPNMATMLCFILTDAAVASSALRPALVDAVGRSFNRISVDGDQSTNDTALILANGAAGNRSLAPGHRDWGAFVAALRAITLRLALKIARDGEGATKLITVRVTGARTDAEADAAARAVANSFLVKTCWHGDYPNWGRVMDAIGYSAARVEEGRVSIAYDRLPAVRNGVATGVPVKRLSAVQAKERFTITIDLGLGKGSAEVYTCDCSEDYVKINVDYVQKMTGRGPT